MSLNTAKRNAPLPFNRSRIFAFGMNVMSRFRQILMSLNTAKRNVPLPFNRSRYSDLASQAPTDPDPGHRGGGGLWPSPPAPTASLPALTSPRCLTFSPSQSDTHVQR